MLNNELYINCSYLKGGTITGQVINKGNGTFSVDANGNLVATSATIKGVIANEYTKTYAFDNNDASRVQQIMLDLVTPTSSDYEKYDINGDGVIDIYDLTFIVSVVLYGGTCTQKVEFHTDPRSSSNYVYTKTVQTYGNGRVVTNYPLRISGAAVFADTNYNHGGDTYSYQRMQNAEKTELTSLVNIPEDITKNIPECSVLTGWY